MVCGAISAVITRSESIPQPRMQFCTLNLGYRFVHLSRPTQKDYDDAIHVVPVQIAEFSEEIITEKRIITTLRANE